MSGGIGMDAGIYRFHKPAGPSSFAALRAIAPADRRSCHGGTLDPFASGLMLMLVQPATQLFELLHDLPKMYEAEVRWGVETDNGDPTGRVIAEQSVNGMTPERLDAALAAWIGWHDQTPPATSAIRVDGERAYARVHRGETVTMTPRRVYLHAAEWIDHDLPTSSRLRLTVRGGFYVRSLVRDIGRAVGCGAHVSALRRTRIGPWEDPPTGSVVRVEPTLPWMKTRVLTDEEVGELKGGRSVASGSPAPPAWRLPDGFRTSGIAGVWKGRVCFVLDEYGAKLKSRMLLRGGI